MTKIQQTIYISAKDVEIKDNKLVVKNGEFYFQDKKYYITDGQIKGE